MQTQPCDLLLFFGKFQREWTQQPLSSSVAASNWIQFFFSTSRQTVYKLCTCIYCFLVTAHNLWPSYGIITFFLSVYLYVCCSVCCFCCSVPCFYPLECRWDLSWWKRQHTRHISPKPFLTGPVIHTAYRSEFAWYFVQMASFSVV